MKVLIDFLMAHWGLSLIFIGFLGFLVVDFMQNNHSGGTNLSPEEVTHLINRKKAVFVDLRDEDSFKKGHVVNAIPMPLQALIENPDQLKKYKDRPIVLACFLGRSCMKAVPILREKGYDQIYTLAGGMKAWNDAKLPVVRGAS